tara:strand:- start:2798 stop:3082 length:285 start_codon:yes stop_codon:yes gene_type:complete
MNIKYKNDLNNSTMTVVVKLQKRKKLSGEKIIVKWPDVEKLVQENYTPPKTHSLGECKNKFLVANNNSDNQLLVKWTFELTELKTKKKTSSRKK